MTSMRLLHASAPRDIKQVIWSLQHVACKVTFRLPAGQRCRRSSRTIAAKRYRINRLNSEDPIPLFNNQIEPYNQLQLSTKWYSAV